MEAIERVKTALALKSRLYCIRRKIDFVYDVIDKIHGMRDDELQEIDASISEIEEKVDVLYQRKRESQNE